MTSLQKDSRSYTGKPPASWISVPMCSRYDWYSSVVIPDVFFWSLWPNYTIISTVSKRIYLDIAELTWIVT